MIDDQVLEVEIVPYDIPEEFDKSKLAFTWRVVEYDGKELKMKLDFEYPTYVSLNLIQDLLVVRFLEPELFISK